MSKSVRNLLLSLLATSCFSGCGQNAPPPVSNNNDNQVAVPTNPDACDEKDKAAIRVGDKDIQLKLEGGDWRWNTDGSFLTLTDKGNGKDVELVESKIEGGQSAPEKDCLRSGSYIRLARNGASGDDRYLQAYQGSRVTIGNYQDINAVFYVIKASDAGNPTKSVIHNKDIVLIRGVTKDPWLVAPTSPTDGAFVGLDTDGAKASKWQIRQKGE